MRSSDNWAWLQIDRLIYNRTVGESYPALCDVDGDSKPEVVIGLGTYPTDGGWLEVKDDLGTGFTHLAWLRVDWSSYISVNGATYPGCGDLDGDNRDEICVGLGNGGGGRIQCFDDAGANYLPMSGTPFDNGWVQVDWPVYSSAVGLTHPALCDVDGDNRAEIVIGLGAYPTAGGWLEVIDDAMAGFMHLSWLRVDWPDYNGANGETRPACGDLDGVDKRDELVIGLGSYPGSGGWLEVKDDAVAGYAHQGWVQVDWPAYNSANGETFPTCGNLDGDSRDELLIGLGSYVHPDQKGGWLEVKDDAMANHAHLDWLQVHWDDYNSADGKTRPAMSR